MDAFEAYGQAAAAFEDDTVRAGRYRFQKAQERRIIDDVRSKLQLGPADRLLEIGCGPGNLLLPLALHVRQAVGVDHPTSTACVARKEPPDNVELVAGRWPEVTVDGKFDKVLIYSAIQCLQSIAEVFAFLDAAVEVLLPGGRLLVGDIPNQSAVDRFRATDFGRRFSEDWQRLTATVSGEDRVRNEFFAGVAGALHNFDDAFVLEFMSRYRSRGLETYVLPQDADLPFCHTREDLLIKKRLV